MEIVGETIIDEILKKKDRVFDSTRPDKESAENELNRILELVTEYSSNTRIIRLDTEVGTIPIIFIELNKFNIYIIVLGDKVKLTATLSLKIFERIHKITKNNKKTILIYYSKNGIIMKTAYLFLGYLIEKHNIGILFVNGASKEIAEIIESLVKKGEFKPEEEDYIRIGVET